MDRRYRQVMSELLDGVVSGEFPAETWMPGVEVIAADRACSVAAAREALRALEERRVVEVVHGRGPRVRADDRWDLLDGDVANAVLFERPARSFLADAVEAFRLVETQAAMLAARRAAPGDVRLISGVLDRMRDGGSTRAEVDFHRTLALVANNRFVASMLETLPAVLVAARRRRSPGRDAMAVRLLARVVPALRETDPTAAAAAIEDYGRRLPGWLGL